MKQIFQNKLPTLSLFKFKTLNLTLSSVFDLNLFHGTIPPPKK